MTKKCYRWVEADMTSSNGTEEAWEVGVWKEHTGRLELCVSGYHACEHPLDALQYTFTGTRLFLAEAEGFTAADTEKFVARRMRLLKEVPDLKPLLVRFAYECAKRVLPIWQERFPEDTRPPEAIAAAEAWLQEPSFGTAAARSAWSAARSADAAAEAAWSAAAADAAAWAVRSAAWAVRSAAAAAATAGEKESAWQRRTFKRIIMKALKEAE